MPVEKFDCLLIPDLHSQQKNFYRLGDNLPAPPPPPERYRGKLADPRRGESGKANCGFESYQQ